MCVCVCVRVTIQNKLAVWAAPHAKRGEYFLSVYSHDFDPFPHENPFNLEFELLSSASCLGKLWRLLACPERLASGILLPRHQGLNCPVPYGASFQFGHPIPRAVLVLAGWLLATVGCANVAHGCA